MVSTDIDVSLVERVRRGEYVVDAEAVAEAMLRRWRRESAVLVAAQALHGPAVAAGEDEAAPGRDVA
jgi:hypothetical protein